MTSPITISEAETIDGAALLIAEEQRRMDQSIETINDIIAKYYHKIRLGEQTFQEHLSCNWGKEFDVVQSRFYEAGFKVGWYPPHSMIYISIV